MELSQRQTDHKGKSNLQFLNELATFLLTTVKSIRMETKYPQFRVRTTSLKGNIVLQNYLINYPLFGTKHLDCLDWFKVLEYFKSKEHIQNVQQITNIKSNMNDNRKIFIWDQLKKFYKLDV
jgi:hypothetical protein